MSNDVRDPAGLYGSLAIMERRLSERARQHRQLLAEKALEVLEHTGNMDLAPMLGLADVQPRECAGCGAEFVPRVESLRYCTRMTCRLPHPTTGGGPR